MTARIIPVPRRYDRGGRFADKQRRILACQCERWEEPCVAAVTAEDFLCDRCRGGCQFLAIGPPEEPRSIFRHIKIEGGFPIGKVGA